MLIDSTLKEQRVTLTHKVRMHPYFAIPLKRLFLKNGSLNVLLQVT